MNDLKFAFRQLLKNPGFAPVVMGDKRQLIVWHPDAVAGLEPETGTPLFQDPESISAYLGTTSDFARPCLIFGLDNVS